MKVAISLLGLLLAMACGSTKLVETNSENINTTEPAGPDGLKVQMPKKESGFTDAAKIGATMNFLASDDLEGRDSGSEGIEEAAKYIEQYFMDNGVKPYFESYRDTLSNFKKPSYNIVGIVEGNDSSLKNEYILIGAHYDHIGIIKAENGDAIANGANDNASGTTSVMEIARYFGTNKTNKRSLIFALFSAEEQGLLGSKHLAKKLKEEKLNLYTMLNFEMTGVPLQGKDYELYITGYEMSNLADVSNTYAGKKLIGFLPTAKEYNLFQRSDNYDFYKEFNVPSHTFCTFDFTNFDHYHKVGDENDIMDFEHMASMVNKMLPVLEGISNAASQEIKLQ
jgi:aminopeptidase-like protein